MFCFYKFRDGRIAKTTYLDGSNIEAYSGTGELDSLYVQIECKVSDTLAEEITEATEENTDSLIEE